MTQVVSISQPAIAKPQCMFVQPELLWHILKFHHSLSVGFMLGALRLNSIAESTKNRNHKLPQSSVANVPVASQTSVGMLFFPRKVTKRIAIAFFIAGKSHGSLGGGHCWGPSLRFFTCVRKAQSQSQKYRDTWCTQSIATQEELLQLYSLSPNMQNYR